MIPVAVCGSKNSGNWRLEPLLGSGVAGRVHDASESDPWYSEVPVSDDKHPDREDADAPPAPTSSAQLDDDDPDDLDGDGFDRAVAAARERANGSGDLDPSVGERPYTSEEAGLRTKVGWGRSPIVSVAVIVVGLFLLAATWSDFRYFLRVTQSEPRQLGHVTDIYQAGEFTERFDNEWVVLEGDPDVQHAARMPSREGWIGFMRLIGADASMFVAVPRATEKASNEFPGRFEGRMQRLSKVPQWERLQTFFNAEAINNVIDLAPASVLAALQNGGTEVEAEDGSKLALDGSDKLRVIVRQSAAMVQLGRTTWPTREAAEQTMQVFGRPWTFVEKRDAFWVFAVELGVDAKLELFQELTRALNDGEDLLTADPKVGGLVFPRRATYLVDFGDLQADPAGQLSFTYADNTAGTGYRVEGEELVPVELANGRLSVPVAAIEDVRLERPLVANPDGYLLMVDQRPRDVWPSAVMFIAVFGVVALNGWALAGYLRRRRAEA